MPTDPTTTQPAAETPTAPAPDREISLEEWIAAGQGCCGAGDE